MFQHKTGQGQLPDEMRTRFQAEGGVNSGRAAYKLSRCFAGVHFRFTKLLHNVSRRCQSLSIWRNNIWLSIKVKPMVKEAFCAIIV